MLAISAEGDLMAQPISANIPHRLGKEEARRRIADGFGNLHQQLAGGMARMFSFSVQERWEGDRLHFEAGGLGQKMTGRLDVRDDSIQIEVDVPDLLVSLADKIIARLKEGTQKLLQGKSADPRAGA